MSKDTIYRQDAIDALADYIRNLDKVYSTGKLSAHDCKDAAWSVLGELPPAQPESAQWVQMLINPNLYKCSNCQVAWNKRFVFDNEGYSENIFMKYCPCCGRKMKTKVDYE